MKLILYNKKIYAELQNMSRITKKYKHIQIIQIIYKLKTNVITISLLYCFFRKPFFICDIMFIWYVICILHFRVVKLIYYLGNIMCIRYIIAKKQLIGEGRIELVF